MKVRKAFRFSWFVLCYAAFMVFAHEAEQDTGKPERASREQPMPQPISTLLDTRGQGPPARVRQGALPDDSLERMYDKNYMHYDYHEYNTLDDDEWHDYFND